MTFYADYAPIEEFLVGRCGKTELQAMYVSFRELDMLAKGKDMEMRTAWEIARWEQFMQISISPNIKAGSKPHSPIALMRFPWEQADAVSVPEPLTEAQVAGLKTVYAMFYGKGENTNPS